MKRARKVERPDEVLAAEYVLGVLPHPERQAFAARLENDDALRSEVRFWSEQLSPLADEIEAVEPAAAVFKSIENRLFDESAIRRSLWSSLAFWRGLAIACLAAIVFAGIYVASLPGPAPDRPSYVAEISGDAAAVRLIVLFEPDTGLLKLNRTDGLPQAGRDFELWLIEGDSNPISLGVLPADKKTALLVPENLRNRFPNAVLAVSDEPQGGSPTGQPTGAVLATGAIAEI